MPLTRVMLQPPQWGSSDLHQQNCHCNIRLFSRWLGYSLSARGWFHPTSEPDLPISSPSTCPLLSPNISVTLLYPPKSSGLPRPALSYLVLGIWQKQASAHPSTSVACSWVVAEVPYSNFATTLGESYFPTWWIILLVNHTFTWHTIWILVWFL